MNINYFLIIIIVFGVLTILTQKEGIEGTRNEEVEEKPTPAYYLFVVFMGIAGAFLIWYKLKTMDMGYVAYLISGLGGVLIIYLSILGMEKNSAA